VVSLTGPKTSIQAKDISAIVLCGGQGSRMGGLDKGLQTFRGQSLAQGIVHLLRPQVFRVMINANRNLAAYQTFCQEVWPDPEGELMGPLAGFLVGLTHCQTPYLMTTPCDTPMIPSDLCLRMRQALSNSNAQVAMVRTLQANPSSGTMKLKTQPVLCMMNIQVRAHLMNYLNQGGRKVETWAQELNPVWVDYDQEGDDPMAFCNLNTLNELKALEPLKTQATPSLCDASS